MLTEECKLNTYLTENNIDIVDTHLGKRIVQPRKEHPGHIMMPAVQLKKKDVR